MVIALLLVMACSTALTIGVVLVIDAVFQFLGRRIYGLNQDGSDFLGGSTVNCDLVPKPRAFAAGQSNSGVYAKPCVRPPYSAF